MHQLAKFNNIYTVHFTTQQPYFSNSIFRIFIFSFLIHACRKLSECGRLREQHGYQDGSGLYINSYFVFKDILKK